MQTTLDRQRTASLRSVAEGTIPGALILLHPSGWLTSSRTTRPPVEREQFDDLTRALANNASRRRAIKALAGGAVGGVAALIGAGANAAPKSAKPDCCPSDHPTLCSLTCTDTRTDPVNCGACGNA